MPSVNYVIKSKKEQASLYIRFSHTRKLDKEVPTGIYVNPKHWDRSRQKLKNVIGVPDKEKLNSKLGKLKIEMIDKFNLDFTNGIIIDKYWVKKTVEAFFNRPKKVMVKGMPSVYLSEFCQWWLDNKADTWQTGASSYLSKRNKAQYQSFLKLLLRFENNEKLKLREITADDLNKFSRFMEDNNYQPSTIRRHITRFKFFCGRAEEFNIDVNKSYKSKKVFVPKDEEGIKDPYLNEDEIQLIYNYDFSYSEELETTRDNFIIGLWTGLRISDFLKNLNILNINGEYIDIKTQKTSTFVSIPLHWMIKEILNKRDGQLPKNIGNFNKNIKTICFIVGIDNIMKGKLTVTDKKTKTKRKILGMYPKWKLVSSHICRRSWATNLYGKVPNHVIQKCGGWATESMMLHYIKKSNRDSAEQLKKHYDKNN